MSTHSEENSLEIIEVPPELRGLSDEEIIKRSEKPLREVSGKRKNGAKRPSKRERVILKQQKEQQEAQKMAQELFSKDLPGEKREMLDKAFTRESTSYSILNREPTPVAKLQVAKPEPPKPAPTRILKASFGVKIGEKPKAVIISAAELARQKAEEKARKVREALFGKKAAQVGDSASVSATAEGAPVKRPRGRPRKNPLPEA